ncbi:MAG: hypothetical protein HN353_05490 [Bdellovibrionales bacterium]|jgi:hypothetical protein|nr:hypothetical protein [Bdellovibrionales bacterium]MBT3525105.1 hypothetical protein [Bdellovibrionales bacterium]MBT7669876.1 hypothetical protein [Bdellovibrionales bacterium]MBT7767266.1 hypothetical protein [Bdellovibrionales bacterium]
MSRIDTSKSVAKEVVKLHKTIKEQHKEVRLREKREAAKKVVDPDIYNGKWRRSDFGVKVDHFELAQYNIKKLDIL